MKLHPIEIKLDCQNELQEIDQLFDAKPNSPEHDRDCNNSIDNSEQIKFF